MNKDDIEIFNEVAEDILQYINKKMIKHIYSRKDVDEKRNLECLLNILQVALTANLWGNGLFRKIYLFDKKLKDSLLSEIIEKAEKSMDQLHLDRMEALKCGATLH